MKGALVIFCAMVVIGIILYLTDIFYYRRKRAVNPPSSSASGSKEISDDATQEVAEGEVCCGMHAICEKTNLSPVSDEIVYYDDEELDRFRGREAKSYSEAESDEFRDVMLTMKPEEVAGWSRSLQLRGIILPSDIRDELLMIVSDLRS